MPSTNDAEETPRFERVDWEEVDASGRVLTPARKTFLAGVAVLAVLFVYDRYVGGYHLVGEWDVTILDWLVLLSGVAVVAYGIVPATRRRSLLGRVASRLRARPAALGAGIYLLVFVLVGLVGPLLVSRPGLQFDATYQPPLRFSTTAASQCVGEITGSVFNEVCHGTTTYPLGTDSRGIPLTYLLVSGARVALIITVVGVAVVVPLAAAVGVVAGLRGGVLDDALMGYVDIQLSLPAIVLYFFGYIYLGASLMLLLVTFGLLSWGGIARLVRSETLQRREDGHVLVARSLGASEWYLARRHILPNITNTLVPAVFHVLALLILVEVGVSFLGFKELNTYSWGLSISRGLFGDAWAYEVWWASTIPTLALTATLASLKLLGDGLRDTLDPRQEGS